MGIQMRVWSFLFVVEILPFFLPIFVFFNLIRKMENISYCEIKPTLLFWRQKWVRAVFCGAKTTKRKATAIFLSETTSVDPTFATRKKGNLTKNNAKREV